MKHIKKCKASKNEIRFGKALRHLKRWTSEDWERFSVKSDVKGREKIHADGRSIFYGHEANRRKDLKVRKNWRLKHPFQSAKAV